MTIGASSIKGKNNKKRKLLKHEIELPEVPLGVEIKGN